MLKLMRLLKKWLDYYQAGEYKKANLVIQQGRHLTKDWSDEKKIALFTNFTKIGKFIK